MAQRLVNLTDEDIQFIKETLANCPSKYSTVLKIVKKFDRSQQRIKNSSAKGKGRELQYKICNKISKLLNIPYNQQDDTSEIHSREMGQRGTDIVLRGEARRRFPFDVECKAYGSSLDIAESVKQAEANAGEGRLGMLVYKQTNRDPVVVFSWDAFETLYDLYIRRD